MAMFDFSVKNARREFSAAEWGSDKPLFFKGLNIFETLTVNELFEKYRDPSSSIEERVKASFEMLKIALVDEDGNAVLADEDFEAVKNAPAAPIVRAWCYAMNSDYNRGETFKKK